MKDLPSVSAFKIEKELNNFQRSYHADTKELRSNRKVNVKEKINQIFSSYNHVYKSKVRITEENDILEKVIVGVTKDYLLTLSGEKIIIKDILDIERI